jgi:hypothetical protein
MGFQTTIPSLIIFHGLIISAGAQTDQNYKIEKHATALLL